MIWIVLVTLSITQILSSSASPLHTTRLLSIIRNATSVNSIHTVGDKVTTITITITMH